MTYLSHLTLTTGMTRRSPRDEVADDAIEHTRDLLDIAAAAEGQVAMPIPGYDLEVIRFGQRRAALVTISRADGQPLVSFGVAARPSPALWRQLVELQRRINPAVPAPEQPQAPWCAVVLLPALALDRAAVGWLGDFELCAAWAWIS